MITNTISKNILKKEKININFVGELCLNKASDRIFSKTFSEYLNTLDNCKSKIINEISDNNSCDVAIFKKSYPLKEIKKVLSDNHNLLIGIINPSDNNKEKEKLKIADFAIVGSVEEKAYYSKYIKCFIYPLIEDVNKKYIKTYIQRPSKTICYHGNKQHLDLINIHLEKALIKLVNEGYKFKAIYNFKQLGKCKKKFITDHIDWDLETRFENISNSTVGICPTTHNSGIIRSSIGKFLIRKSKNKNDFILQYKNTINASRAFIFHQLKIPVIAEIGGSFHHLLGDETAGYLCYSEESWYEAITKLCNDKRLNKEFSEKAYSLMNKLYDPKTWCEKFLKEFKYWIKNEY